jgi:NAD(P)H-dependent FMN reductase
LEKLKIKVVLGSVREGRNADKVWKWVEKQLQPIEAFDVELLDLKAMQLPMFSEEAFPSSRAPHISEAAQAWSAKMDEADGFVVITPEYNHSVPGALRNAFDYLAFEWAKKPVAIISYGAGVGGARAAESLKAFFTYMESTVIPVEVNIINVWAAFDENGELPDNYAGTAKKVFASLEWWAGTLREARKTIPKK